MRIFYLAASLFLLLGLGSLSAWWTYQSTKVRLDSPPTASKQIPDPRRTYTGPYRNIDPDVGYVGDAKCASCHEEIARSYANHPMGRSLAPAADVLDRQPYSPSANNPFTAFGRRFHVDRQDKKVWHQQSVLTKGDKPIAELSQEVHWAIGSGKKGYSYLTERDGYLLQTPISWFEQKNRWDLSPGFGPSVLTGRVVTGSCLFCHTNRVREHPDHPDRFASPVFDGHAIGCERCHGPGELHAAGDLDHTIVNPKRLSPVLRNAVCEQCHLEGEARILRAGRSLFDYRPGLPMSDFWAVLVQARQGSDDAKAVNHVEQMYRSKCYQRSAGQMQMGCTTCHDPHVPIGPKERDTHYRAACLKCHNQDKGQIGCSLPSLKRLQTNPKDSCIDCHMPQFAHSDIAHAASTDHRIIRRSSENQLDPKIDLENARFQDFYQDRFPNGDRQAERTLGLGLVKLMTLGLVPPERSGRRTLALLESALADNPEDLEVVTGKLQVLLLLGRNSEAHEEAALVLSKRPQNWRVLFWAAGAAKGAGQLDLAIDYYRKGVEINPFAPEHQLILVDLLIQSGQIEEATSRCKKLLDLDPFNLPGRQVWVNLLLKAGKKTEARSQFEIIRGLHPPDILTREEWFRQQSQ